MTVILRRPRSYAGLEGWPQVRTWGHPSRLAALAPQDDAVNRWLPPLERAYLHSCSARSSACERPLSENWSVVWVPRPEVPLTVRSAPLRMASIMRASSATFLIQAPSFWVYIANLAVPISAVASVLGLNG